MRGLRTVVLPYYIIGRKSQIERRIHHLSRGRQIIKEIRVSNIFLLDFYKNKRLRFLLEMMNSSVASHILLT